MPSASCICFTSIVVPRPPLYFKSKTVPCRKKHLLRLLRLSLLESSTAFNWPCEPLPLGSLRRTPSPRHTWRTSLKSDLRFATYAVSNLSQGLLVLESWVDARQFQGVATEDELVRRFAAGTLSIPSEGMKVSVGQLNLSQAPHKSRKCRSHNDRARRKKHCAYHGIVSRCDWQAGGGPERGLCS